LNVWQKPYQLTVAVCGATESFPPREIYGLTSRIRRASTSIPANIAEGCGREGQAELSRFLLIAAGSASELQYHFLLARDLNMLEEPRYSALDQQAHEVKRMLAALVRRVRPGAGDATPNCELPTAD
jgi:four helix bundle protein